MREGAFEEDGATKGGGQQGDDVLDGELSALEASQSILSKALAERAWVVVARQFPRRAGGHSPPELAATTSCPRSAGRSW
jgi:hypothetical protein